MDINTLLKDHPSLLHADEMAQITNPLKKLGIDYFAHVHLDEEGNFFANNNKPEYFEQYFRQGFYKYDVHMGNIESDGFFLWDSINLLNGSRALYELAQSYGVGHLCTLMRKKNNSSDFYHFGVKPGRSGINNFYTQHLDLLQKYVTYFNEQLFLNDRLHQSRKHTCGVTKNVSYDDPQSETGNGFWVDHATTLPPKQLDEYLESLGITAKPSTQQSITRREYQCGYYLLQGFTSKQIAEALHISPRTVEVYLERLRTRFGSKNKIQLVCHLIESKSINTEF